MRKIRLLTITYMSLLAAILNTAHANEEYGLFIKSFPSTDQEKTSLVLENGQPLELGKETTLSFEMSVRRDNVFGNVFRIITNSNKNIDLAFTVGENDIRYPMLVVDESVSLINREIECDKWIPVSVTLSAARKEITLTYNHSKTSIPYEEITKVNRATFNFGLCTFEGNPETNVASVNIRNIKIFDGNDLIRFWKLDNHRQSLTYDSLAHVPAVTTNPIWVNDIYSSWEKIYSSPVEENAEFAFNPDQSIIYIVSPTSKRITAFDAKVRTEEVIAVKEGFIASNAPNQLVYDTLSNQLISYNLDENIISRFSFADNSWSSNTPPTSEHGYWNNAAFYLPGSSTLVSFSGYGFYKYNNDLIRFNLNDRTMKKCNLPEISPRYSSATAVVNNMLYVFGGRGNKSGRQELSPHNFYDFYAVNLLTEQTSKLWELSGIGSEFLPSENMIYDEKEGCFYVYTTMDGGTLLKLKKDESSYEQVSFPVLEDLSAHYLYINLYYSPAQKKLYTLVNKIKTDRTAHVSIYSLNYPPVKVIPADLLPAESAEEGMKWWYFVLGGAIVGAGLLIYMGYRRWKRNEKNEIEPQQPAPAPIEENISEPIPELAPVIIEPKPTEAEHSLYDFSTSSICFMGGFTVIDSQGENVTAQFSAILKHLLLLLILMTVKTGKGISGRKLIQCLWFDKSEDAGKNNRNVYLSKLRTTLETVGNAEIINKNSFMAINLHDIACDYTEAMLLFDRIAANQTPVAEDIDRLMELLSRGVLLPNTEADWVDDFKSDFSNMTIDSLTALVKSNSDKLTDGLKLKIADILFLHDTLNEEALYLKCSIFFHSGKKGLAKTAYDNFAKEYLKLLGTEYKYSLADVIEQNNVDPFA